METGGKGREGKGGQQAAYDGGVAQVGGSRG
jgi:hypothetical protein